MTGTIEVRRERCGNCKWWDGDRLDARPDDTAACRRYPPPTNAGMERAEERADQRHSWTSYQHYCGEWQKADANEWVEIEVTNNIVVRDERGPTHREPPPPWHPSRKNPDAPPAMES